MIQAEHYRNEQDGLQHEQRGGTQELMRLEREISEIQRWLGELAVLKNRFALVDDVKVLEQQLLAARTPMTSSRVPWRNPVSSPRKTWTSACVTWRNA